MEDKGKSLWTNTLYNVFQLIFTGLLFYFNSIVPYSAAHMGLVRSGFVAPAVIMENVQ